jgi:hypothetical protein
LRNTKRKLHRANRKKLHGVLLHDNACPHISYSHWSTAGVIQLGVVWPPSVQLLISLRATTTCLPTWITVWDHSSSPIMRSWWKVSKHDWADTGIQNVFLDTTVATVPAVTRLRSSLSIYILFVYNIFSPHCLLC